MHLPLCSLAEQAGCALSHGVEAWSFPLERAADAHAALEQRLTDGKTLLLV
jgi:hypothetical protein